MQMKKILGILLAVCFLMSVTVAAVSATSSPVNKQNGKFTPSKHVEKIKYKLVKIPAHIEFKKVKKFIGFKHGKKVYKTITIKIRVPAKWIKVPVYNKHPKVHVYNNQWIKVPVYNNHNNPKVPVYNNHNTPKVPVYNNHNNPKAPVYNNYNYNNNYNSNYNSNNDNRTPISLTISNNDNRTPIS